MAETNGDALSENQQKIIRQIEYYFGDINLARDRFLQEQIKLDDGWVPMETMMKFNRLKVLSEDNKVICEAIKKSKSDLMEVSEDFTKIRRSSQKPLPENTRERREEINCRTMYVKGFPLELSLDELLLFFTKHGKLENLVMRKDMNRKFKGSVFAVFGKKDDFENFLKDDCIKYEGTDLIKLAKDDYHKSKTEKRRKQKEEQMKEKQEEQLKKMEEKEKVSVVPGAILHLVGFTQELERDDIKNFFSDYAKVAWVDYNGGDKEAWVRFHGENQAKTVLENFKDDEEMKIKDNVLKGDILEGDAEYEHWKKISEARSASGRKNKKRGWKQGGRNKRDNKHRFGKRWHDDGDNSDGEGGAPSKAAKTED